MLNELLLNFWKPDGTLGVGVAATVAVEDELLPVFPDDFLPPSANAATTPMINTMTTMMVMMAIKPPRPFLGWGAIGPPGNPGCGG